MITNFRDLGNLKNRQGQFTKNNRLLRSGELYQLTADDISLLNNHNLVKVIDFRNDTEIAKHPDVMITDTDYVHINLFKGTQESNASLSDFMQLKNPDDVDTYMESLYQQLILDENAQQGYKEFFNQLMFVEGSSIFHCFAGKDRTGVAAMLVLELLDVPRNLIFDDYLKTNASRKKANDAMLQAISTQYTLSNDQKKAVLTALEVQKKYLETAYYTLDTKFGGIENYIKQVCGWKESDIDTFRMYYLTPKTN